MVRRHGWRWLAAKYLLALPLLAVVLAVGALAGLDTPIGHRFLADWLGTQTTDTGLAVSIGRIDGSIYGRAQLEDISLRDPAGTFLTAPSLGLDWQPLAWVGALWGGGRLDIHELVLRRGHLLRLPRPRPGPPSNPQSPILPKFDVRVDRLTIDRLQIAPGIAGPMRRIDLAARIDIHRHRALIDLASRLGGADRLRLLLDADERADKFLLALDYAAPRGGLLAALTGTPADRLVRIDGRGHWQSWRGQLVATQAGHPLAALTLSNHSGMFALGGKVETQPWLAPRLAAIVGGAVDVLANGRLDNGALAGEVRAAGPALIASAKGRIDLTANRFDHLAVALTSRGELVLGPQTRLAGARAQFLIDGPFGSFVARSHWGVARLAQGGLIIAGLEGAGPITRAGRGWRAPLAFTAERVITGRAAIDARLVALRASATAGLVGTNLALDHLTLAAPGLGFAGAMRGDLAHDGYAVSGRLSAAGLALGDAGRGDAVASGTLALGPGPGWLLAAHVAGRAHPTNPTLVTLVGADPAFIGDLAAAAGAPLVVTRATIASDRLSLALAGRRDPSGLVTLTGHGRQAAYGAFAAAATISADGPRATFHFDAPWPPGGLRDVQLAIAPEAGGYAITTRGISALGPFDGALGLVLPPGAAARLDLRRMTVAATQITGAVTLGSVGPTGTLSLSGGGLTGNVKLAPQSGGEAIDARLVARDARFGNGQPITLARGQLAANGLIARQHTTIAGMVQLQGLEAGGLRIARGAAKLALTDGSGEFGIALEGRRTSRFILNLGARISPARWEAVASGSFGSEAIRSPQPIVITRAGGGWALGQTEFDVGKGRIVAWGTTGAGSTSLNLALADVSLALGDALVPDLGLAGAASGVIGYASQGADPPTGEARLVIRGLTRAGLALTSRPIDGALTASLGPTALELRAIAKDSGGGVVGRLQARIANLPPAGALLDRLRAGALAAALRYSGPADAPWRLLAIDTFDLTGPISLAADLGGSLDAPLIKGALSSSSLHLQSPLTGTDISTIAAQGSFAGPRLTFSSLAGHTAGGGLLVGSGFVDLSGFTQLRGPVIDLRLAAMRAQLVNRSDMAFTATGPLRILSDGEAGTIAGRLRIDAARWRLGQAPAVASLPNIATREIHLAGSDSAPQPHDMPWRFVIDANTGGALRVTGLGLDSQWSAAVRLRGTIDDPEITGTADMTGGSYEFAGQHFDLTRGHLDFAGDDPPDPLLDIAATQTANGLTATVTVRGSSFHPEIAFTSVPPLPEQELLSRLLFGASVTDISAPEAIQLASALAALHGQGGLDPINKLRTAVGLDRLRVVSADPTIPHQTGVAVGKNIGRRIYTELMTDGHGYSATSIEYRITRWLSLLASVSTINRQNVNARISHDY